MKPHIYKTMSGWVCEDLHMLGFGNNYHDAYRMWKGLSKMLNNAVAY